MADKPRIFVSYARSDGGEVAQALRRRLEGHGLPLWQDLVDMEGGKDWWRQIVEAIKQVEYLVLVMTPGGLASDVVPREWRLARQEGVCVIPVMGAPDLNFSLLPQWMRQTHFVDTGSDDQWRRFLGTLERPCQIERVAFMVEDLPEDFVDRPGELEPLVSQLLDEKREGPVAITAALRGAGGYGKTALARAICHQEAIQDAYHDGILWVTLGNEPGDIKGRVEDLIHTLSGARPGYSELQAAVARLAALLEDRSALIVIDDVWNAAHLRPFLQGGPNCARLITTRDSATLPPACLQTKVDAMRVDEAVRLLSGGLPDLDGVSAQKLAERLGEWPLLLKLVNGVLRDRVTNAGQPLTDAVSYVERSLDRRGLTAFDAEDPQGREQAVATTLGISMELLDEDERARFSELAIFPEDADVPLGALETLWASTAEFDDLDTEDLCARLFRLSLLLDLDLMGRRIRLHDVVRAYLQDLNREALTALHQKLIDAYRKRCEDGWPRGPNDGYFFQYLPYHLAGAAQNSALRALLVHYDWLAAKLDAVDANAAIADFDLLRDDGSLAPLQQSIRLSAPALSQDRRQLAAQLLGRLAPEDGPELAPLLNAARRQAPKPALLPLRPTLTPPGAELRRFEGHEGGVNAVALSADGRRALSGSDDETLRLWDLESGAELRRFESHEGGITTVALSADGRRALSGSDDKTLRLWDLESGAELAAFHDDWAIHCCAISGDQDRIVMGDAFGRIHVLEIVD